MIDKTQTRQQSDLQNSRLNFYCSTGRLQSPLNKRWGGHPVSRRSQWDRSAPRCARLPPSILSPSTPRSPWTINSCPIGKKRHNGVRLKDTANPGNHFIPKTEYIASTVHW